MPAENFYKFEKQAVAHLEACFPDVCTVRAVNDFWDVLNFAPEVVGNGTVKRGALFVHFDSYKVLGKQPCSMFEQIWTISVVTKNLCDIIGNKAAREENGLLMTRVFESIAALAEALSPAVVLQVTQGPRYPVQERLGVCLSHITVSIK